MIEATDRTTPHRKRSFKNRLMVLVALAVAVPALLTCLVLGVQLNRQARHLFANGLAANLETFALVLQDAERNVFDGLSRMASDNTLQVTLDLEMASQLRGYIEAQRQVLRIAFVAVYDASAKNVAFAGSGKDATLGQWHFATNGERDSADCAVVRDQPEQLVGCNGTVYLISTVAVRRAHDKSLGDAGNSEGAQLLGFIMGGTPVANAALIGQLQARRILHPLMWAGNRLVYSNIGKAASIAPASLDGDSHEYNIDDTAYLGVAKALRIGQQSLEYGVVAPLAPLQQTLWRSILTVAGIGLLIVILALIAVSIRATRLLRPIEQLRLGAARIGGGDLAQRISIESGDEFESLADQFNDMRERLRESYTDLESKVALRTRELAQSVKELRALGEVSQAVNSTLDLENVLDTIVAKAVQLSNTDAGAIYVFDDAQGDFLLRATYGMDQQLIEALSRARINRDDRNVATMLAAHEPVQNADLSQGEMTEVDSIILRAGYRSRLTAPLIRGDDIVGMLVVRRRAPGSFPQSTVDLIKTFAAQSAVAIQNARLYASVETRTRELAASLADLHTAQDRLIQTEKLASLGHLTAGIAHEIKNPLNFVNNFSSVSAELIDELQQIVNDSAVAGDKRAEVAELTAMLRGNLEKVVQHGKRADSIVKNMLLHSRQASSEHQPADINALLEESLNLAYHGARAEKQGFNVTLERSFDPTAGEVVVFPQEITRVLLNLISNGFYATTKRKAEGNGGDYKPTLSAATKNLGNSVEIRIRDNGTGIPLEVREKMFNPFFTTKPPGEGTGLGLSLSHDIIVKQHSGSIEVDTAPGKFTEFRIVLPRGSSGTAKPGGNA